MHCASAGEFEQGKPVIEALKKAHPHYKILVSFFSPSGYAVAKGYSYADYITYLPLDTKQNAERFLQIVQPRLVIFIKYEFWYYHLKAVASRHIPLLLVSAVFRKEQVFFQWYGRFFKRILFLFQQIFVQDRESLALLQAHKIFQSGIGGDTRFDRVSELIEQVVDIPFIKNFIGNSEVIVAGSTWNGDEKLLAAFLQHQPEMKLILAPHEFNDAHLNAIKKLFPVSIFYSGYSKEANAQGARIMVIDNVGLLSRLYQYATITYVGGGFTKDGIHNILEAAVWGKPVIFGLNYKKYREASELIKAGGGFSINNAIELKKLADDLFNNKDRLQATGGKAKKYIEENRGATAVVLHYIQENRLLTKP